eukprot:COSAG02_NODE_1419_length_12701_cov_20.731551_1_plen_36_part_00
MVSVNRALGAKLLVWRYNLERRDPTDQSLNTSFVG